MDFLSSIWSSLCFIRFHGRLYEQGVGFQMLWKVVEFSLSCQAMLPKLKLLFESLTENWLIDFLLIRFCISPSFEELKEDLLELFDFIITALPLFYDLDLLPGFHLKPIQSGDYSIPFTLVWGCASLLLVSPFEQVFCRLHFHKLVVDLCKSRFLR